ncbi:YisL family protein [Bacillus safensis]|uniref:YisL family protein n=1 Tax=Bacillus safensis TaxID=561879 RepID=UPI001BAE2A55|nr:YisL family protein [Bacillus safensis]MBR0614295.1 YisL family protein [Bacillus safensis]MBR0634758.1 YisL family protein [Bacillus safensis]
MGTHLHITAWVLGIILFFVAFALAGKNDKGAKIVHMIVRLFYLIIIATGVELYVRTGMKIPGYVGEYIGKMILGILVIGFMEMVLVRKKKGKSVTGVLIGFIVFAIVTILLGLRLPIGFHIF